MGRTRKTPVKTWQERALEALAKRGFSLTPKQRQRAELLDAAA